jgi:nucleoside-diphosphate-sugar epimerase
VVYILGGEGFVGSGFTRLFGKLNLDHRVITRHNYQELIGSSCNVFINANGNSGKILANRAPLADFDANVRTTRATLEDFTCGCYIHLSSCDVYADCSNSETTREDTPADLYRQSPYGFHKMLAEQCVRHRCDNWLIVRQGGFVGPGMKKNAVYDILYGGKMWLDSESELQFLQTDDSAAIIWSLYDRGIRNEVFNVCGAGLVKLREVIEWSGRKTEITPGSPAVRYAVNINKISRYHPMPDTKITVKSFVEEIKAAEFQQP